MSDKIQMRSDYPAQKIAPKENLKTKVVRNLQTANRVAKNAEQLIVASSLMITSIFAFTQLDTVKNQVWYYSVLASLIIVGLLAFTQLVKFLNRG